MIIYERMCNMFGHLKNGLGEFISIFKKFWSVKFQAANLLMNVENSIVDDLQSLVILFASLNLDLN